MLCVAKLIWIEAVHKSSEAILGGQGPLLCRSAVRPVSVWHQEGQVAGEEASVRRTGSPMQLTRAADYGIRAMIHLVSLPAGRRARLPHISAATGVPSAYLSKVLQTLARAEMVSSSRGRSGGFEALAAGRDASFRQLIEAIDGPMFLNVCVGAGVHCKRKSRCPAHPVWMRAQLAMTAILDGARVADLAHGWDATEPVPEVIPQIQPTQVATDRARTPHPSKPRKAGHRSLPRFSATREGPALG